MKFNSSCPSSYFCNQSTQDSVEIESEQDRSLGLMIGWDVVYVLISIPTVMGNGLIISCLSRFRDDKSSIHILVGNLAIADLMVGAILLPYCIIVDILDLNSDKYACLTKASLTVFTVGGACIGLLLVSIDRFTAICFPLRHHVILSSRRIVVILICGWSYIGILAFLPVSGWNFYDRTRPFTCFYGDVVTPIYHRVVNSHFILLLTVNVTLYLIVIKIALNKSKRVYPTSLDRRTTVGKSGNALYKIKTMAMVQGLFALCWFPYACLGIVLLFYTSHLLKVIQYWTLIPGILNSAFNWLIYGYRNKLLGNQMKLYLRCRSEDV